MLPELFKVTAPVNELALTKLMAPAPALTVTAPPLAACVIAPVCVTPTPVKLSVPLPIDEVAIVNGMPLLVSATLPVPLFEKVTAPVRVLALANVILLLVPAVKLDVPDTDIVPDCEIAPVLLIVKLPPVCDTPAILNVPVLVRLILPLVVLLPLKLLTVLAPFNVLPPTELVVSAAVLIMAVSETAPPDVNETVPPVVMFCPIDSAGVLDALNAFKLVLPPMAPFKVIVPAPDVKLSEFVLAVLLLAAPMEMAPPLLFKLLLPFTVVVPSVKELLVVLMVDAIEVVLAVLVRPPVKVKLFPPLPSVTPLVFKKEIALVMVFVAPFITTA